jgi:hypothetical protein
MRRLAARICERGLDIINGGIPSALDNASG